MAVNNAPRPHPPPSHWLSLALWHSWPHSENPGKRREGRNSYTRNTFEISPSKANTLIFMNKETNGGFHLGSKSNQKNLLELVNSSFSLASGAWPPLNPSWVSGFLFVWLHVCAVTSPAGAAVHAHHNEKRRRKKERKCVFI